MSRHLLGLLIGLAWIVGCPDVEDDDTTGDDDAADDDAGDDDAGALSVEDAAAVILGGEGHEELSFRFDVGDLDGDGIDDLALAAPLANGPEEEILVFHGPLAGTLTAAGADAVISLVVEGGEAWFTGIADVDRDGIGDVLVGASVFGSAAFQSAFGFRGPLPPEASLAQADFLFGVSDPGWHVQTLELIPAGDLDGDGAGDLAVRIQGVEDPGSSDPAVGTVLVQTGAIAPGSVEFALGEPRVSWVGNGCFSMSPARAGDVDGDGVEDLLIHVVDHKGETAVSSLFPGPLEGVALVEQAPASIDGYATAGNFGRPGDLDGDGRHDLVAKTYWTYEGEPGEAWVFPGLEAGAWTLADGETHLAGTNPGDHPGVGACIGGDLDGDGRHDLVVGVHRDDTVAADAGVTYLFTEVPTGELDLASAALRIRGVHEGEGSGWRLLAGGDLDGDGLDDLLIAAPLRSTEAPDVGAIYLFTGAQIRDALQR